MKLNLEDKKTPAQLLMAYEQIFPGIHPEWIDGVIGIKALPGWLHGNVTSQILRAVGGLFHRHKASNGEGGWWIATEISVQYLNTDRILQADLAGWKRDQHSQPPDGFPVTVRPDWVCEVCHTTRKKDRELVPDTLSKAGVPYYWFVDAEELSLEVWELQMDKSWKIIKILTEKNEEQIIQPFGTRTLSPKQLLQKDW